MKIALVPNVPLDVQIEKGKNDSSFTEPPDFINFFFRFFLRSLIRISKKRINTFCQRYEMIDFAVERLVIVIWYMWFSEKSTNDGPPKNERAIFRSTTVHVDNALYIIMFFMRLALKTCRNKLICRGLGFLVWLV